MGVQTEEEDAEARGHREGHADFDVAASGAVAEGSEAEGRSQGEGQHAEERIESREGRAGRACKADVRQSFAREGLGSEHHEVADEGRRHGGDSPHGRCVPEEIRGYKVEHSFASVGAWRLVLERPEFSSEPAFVLRLGPWLGRGRPRAVPAGTPQRRAPRR